ncbi:hypothetical protein [Actibacterium sp. D379-3]
MTHFNAIARPVLAALVLVCLAGCAGGINPFGRDNAPEAVTPDAPRPQPRSDSAAPPAGAHTAEAFDTTTSAERAAAVASPPATRPDRELGRTIASLGDPGDPGFWAKTPLVQDAQPGRLVDPATGNAVLVELRPLAGEGGGSQVSLPALRILGVPLTALPELIVYARP